MAQSVHAPLVRALLAQYHSLHAAASAAEGRITLTGRVPAYAARFGTDRWLVRHYQRGGAVARFLGDRYLRLGGMRAARELNVSAAARARGIATPAVIAAIAYPSGIFMRFDIATEFIAHAHDLAAVLFHDASTDARGAIAAAARLIHETVSRGMVHPDLNLKNILIAKSGAFVIDLDRCRLVARARPQDAAAMQRRFNRSFDKWQRRTGKTIAASVRAQLAEAFHV